MQERAPAATVSPRQLAADLAAAFLFSTRLPLTGVPALTGADIARAGWALPVAGAIVGLISALVYWLARASGLPPLPAAGLTIAASLAATGCLHEDGLADVADSFGGRTRERKLEIMRDSRIGTYGACALLLSLLLRSAALSSIADPALAAPVGASAIAAGIIGIAALGIGLGPAAGACAIALMAVAFGFLRSLCIRQIGGQTGDVLGALEQIGEMIILLVAAASVGD